MLSEGSICVYAHILNVTCFIFIGDPLCFSVGVWYNKSSQHNRIMLFLHFLTCLFFIVHSPSLNSCKNANRHWGMYFTSCGQGLIWVPSWHLPEGTEEEHKSTWVRITTLWAEIWTQDLLSAKWETCVLDHIVSGSELSSIHNCEVRYNVRICGLIDSVESLHFIQNG